MPEETRQPTPEELDDLGGALSLPPPASPGPTLESLTIPQLRKLLQYLRRDRIRVWRIVQRMREQRWEAYDKTFDHLEQAHKHLRHAVDLVDGLLYCRTHPDPPKPPRPEQM